MTPPKIVPWALVSLGIMITRIDGSSDEVMLRSFPSLGFERRVETHNSQLMTHNSLGSPRCGDLRRTVGDGNPLDDAVGQVHGHRPVGVVVGPDVMSGAAFCPDGEGRAPEELADLLRGLARVDLAARLRHTPGLHRGPDAGQGLRLPVH